MTGGSEGAVLSPLLPLPSCRQPAGPHLPRHAGLSLVSLSCRLPVPWFSTPGSPCLSPLSLCLDVPASLWLSLSPGVCVAPLYHSWPFPPSWLFSPSLCLSSPSPSMLSPSVSLSSSSLSVSPSSVWASPLLCFHLLSPPVSASSISSLIWKRLCLHWPLCFPTPRGWTLQTPVWALSDARGPHTALQGLRSALVCQSRPRPRSQDASTPGLCLVKGQVSQTGPESPGVRADPRDGREDRAFGGRRVGRPRVKSDGLRDP